MCECKNCAGDFKSTKVMSDKEPYDFNLSYLSYCDAMRQ